MEVLTTEALINAVQNEPCIWDSTMNETEENKDLTWKRIGDSCGLHNGELQRVHYQPRSTALH